MGPLEFAAAAGGRLWGVAGRHLQVAVDWTLASGERRTPLADHDNHDGHQRYCFCCRRRRSAPIQLNNL